MMKTMVVYEDGVQSLEESAKLIASELSSRSHEVCLRAASSVSIPDILATKFYFFGAEHPNSPSYGEVARVFMGISLAGRTAAYFGASASALASLKKMAADTDLKTVGPDLVEGKPGQTSVVDWLGRIL